VKKIILSIAMLSFAGACFAEEHMHHHDATDDNRLSLGLSTEMRQHQLSNMRSHVDAVRSIVGLIAEGDFDKASEIAHFKLGLTPEMQSMCSTMSGNEKFVNLAFAFHRSGDDLGDALLTKDAKTSLRALNKTMQYCVECHATFRQ
jgi:hypothetical protein